MQKVKTLNIRFKNNITKEEIPVFRSALISSLKENNDVLFHNHIENGFRYAYPLIQYKRINKKAAIFCIQQGTDVIGKLFSTCNFTFHFNNKKVEMEIESIKASQHIIQTWEHSFDYKIRKWLPLNQDNYNKYLLLDALTDKIAFLENILIANILSLSKGLNIYYDKEVQCTIQTCSEPVLTQYKEVKMMAFDIEFKSNVSLPDYIGLGKGVSLGMGVVTRKREKTK